MLYKVKAHPYVMGSPSLYRPQLLIFYGREGEVAAAARTTAFRLDYIMLFVVKSRTASSSNYFCPTLLSSYILLYAFR